ncbi:MAG TPA: hydrogenase maturation protease [Saprospiraceae bacterium]|nr:hydrogenase maturation protease [Saprospiraceae bacterium]HPI07989.1 hydrogenase maturation protease [Saprospiraceae bacterium]
MKNTAILGFGNPVRSDDGVGCMVIDELKKRLGETPPGVSLIDMGTSAFEVLFQLKGHERIILVDGVINTNEPDGTLYRLPASAVDAAIQDDPMVFLHSLKWDQALSYAKKILGAEYPEDISVYLISVTNTRLDLGISEVVLQAGLKVTDLIIEELGPVNA